MDEMISAGLNELMGMSGKHSIHLPTHKFNENIMCGKQTAGGVRGGIRGEEPVPQRPSPTLQVLLQWEC